MNSHSFPLIFENTINTAQFYSQPSQFLHAEETEYMPTLIIEARRVQPTGFRRLLSPHEGLYCYACPLDLGDKCSRFFKNCAEVKAHIFWHFNAFQCETCGRCFGKSDGLKRHTKSTAKCAEGRLKREPILSPSVKQRVKNLQNASGYNAIRDAVKGWVSDFKLPDATSTFAISGGRRNYQQWTRKSSRRKQGATRVLNFNTNVTEPLPTFHIINCGHPNISYPLTNGLEYQMPYGQDTNPWQPAAVSVMNSLRWEDANMAMMHMSMAPQTQGSLPFYRARL